MDRDKEVGLRLVRDGGARLERDKCVVGAGVDNLRVEPVVKQLAEAEGYVEDDVFLLDAVGADGAGVMAAVACVDDDAADLEAERTYERGGTVCGRDGGAGRKSVTGGDAVGGLGLLLWRGWGVLRLLCVRVCLGRSTTTAEMG